MKPGATTRASNTKYYPDEYWQEILIALSQKYPQTPIILIGAPTEYDYLASIAAPLHLKNVYNHSKELNIVELKAICSLAAGIISVDTGPAHIAAALGCPMIELFGPVTPLTHAPLNLGQKICHLVEFDDDAHKENLEANIALITPHQVIERFEDIFNFNRERPNKRILS